MAICDDCERCNNSNHEDLEKQIDNLKEILETATNHIQELEGSDLSETAKHIINETEGLI